ncbi:efflux RND transporter permease subunit [Tropicimonas sp. IMCC6043]|uniref:efflux RND transporter permease subunit n=1 Tax=Tropicimonas sp. IMCC6043 TaxID=2510645 RepID=UPI00101C4FF5|nr:efflux RND transporter permease subunit [Tropicimonas sp. IMCC6043]RYH07135.1 efflux RND transporter permease subunit [Tropicimonas sp. IMCC6043]
MKDFNLSRFAVAHPALVLFLIIILALAGTLSYLRLGRAEDPDFTIKVAIVSAQWPGATAAEMRDQVADPIEKKLQELQNLDRVETYTTSGFMAANVVFRDDTRPADVPDLFYEVRKKLADLGPSLPHGVIGPQVNDEYGDVYSVVYMLTADGLDIGQLKDAGEDIRQRLLRVQDARKVELIGTQPERIFVEFSHVKLATLGIEPRAIFDSLARQNALTPAGQFETDASAIPVRMTGALNGVAAIEAVPVAAGERVFRLGDIATVRRGFIDPPRSLLRQNGLPAIGIGVSMVENGNIIALGEALDAEMAEIREGLPVGLNVEQIADQPEVVEHSIAEFVKAFAEALGIVLLVSFLSLGLRTGLIVALSVPLVLAIVFLVMAVMGIDLNRITLGALIIALGLLVDDAIIAIEMMMVKMEQGWSRAEAAAAAWDITAFPMLTGTLVTAAGFIPVAFARSAVAEYSGGIFWVVAISLIVSWFVAVIFTPYLGMKFLPKVAEGHGNGTPYQGRVYRALRAAIDASVRHRIKVVAATAGLFVAAILGFTNVQQQFFPLSERPELFLQMRLPEGSSITATTNMVEEAEELLAEDPDVIHATSYIGRGSVRFWIALNPELPNPAFAETVILSKDTEARERIKTRLEAAIADGALSGARVRVSRFNFGPPVGHPVQFRVIGDDATEVRRIATQVRDVMQTNPDVRDAHLQWNEMTPAIRLVIDQDRARALGLAPQDVAERLQTLVNGLDVTQMRDGNDIVTVVARAVASERLDASGLGNLTVVSRNGVPVPLSQVARIEPSFEEPILWRRNRDLVISVRADIVDGVQAPQVSSQILSLLEPIKEALPAGYRIETGGTIEESEKGNGSIFAMFPIMLTATLTILMIQLQSFSRLAIVLITAPLGLIGASLALNLFSAPFGFVALLGQIALAGMIMRNSVILVDQIEAEVRSGRDRRSAIVEATVHRARPVVLTALAAILAMIPLSRSVFWGPMAMVIMGGLLVATLLTLFFLPALYALWYRVPRKHTEPMKQDTIIELAIAAE